jgi:hypothetical protein
MLGAPGWYVRCLSSRADILIHSRIIPFFRARDRPLHRLTFNEAATYLSRKRTGADAGILRHRSGFNEAATYLSRKRAPSGLRLCACSRASMRPRLICRGNGDRSMLRAHAKALQ